MMSKTLLALSALVLHVQAGATCFTLVGPDNRTVYQSMSPPFDLSRPLSQSLASRYPGHHLVMADTSDLVSCRILVISVRAGFMPGTMASWWRIRSVAKPSPNKRPAASSLGLQTRCDCVSGCNGWIVLPISP